LVTVNEPPGCRKPTRCLTRSNVVEIATLKSSKLCRMAMTRAVLAVEI